jgi:hypothetical protein
MALSRRDLLSASLGVAATAVNHVRADEPKAGSMARPARGPARPAPEPAGLLDYEPLARRHLPEMAFEYVVGGAESEVTLRENRSAFERLRLHPRVLVDVSHLDTRTVLFGETLEFPILLAPTAYHKLVHPEGEIATARGARAAGAVLVVSSFATTAVEDMAKAAGDAPLWFQLYSLPDRGFTKDLVQRAEAAGCRVLCLTVDSPVLGARNREARTSFALPPGMQRENLRALGAGVAGGTHRPTEKQIYSTVLNPALTWKDVEWLRSVSKRPLVLKESSLRRTPGTPPARAPTASSSRTTAAGTWTRFPPRSTRCPGWRRQSRAGSPCSSTAECGAGPTS